MIPKEHNGPDLYELLGHIGRNKSTEPKSEQGTPSSGYQVA